LPRSQSGGFAVIGRTLAHYQITALIGAGGMGEVYRATDSKLGREVALKVMSAQMASDPDRLQRFHREARAVAALNHPHIVTIFSVEEADGLNFLTMELVAGETLDRIIPPDGLPPQLILEYGAALADALSAAHDHGIVHRDLKPGNVMVTTEGRLKVLDFGLAKELRASAASDSTVTSASQTQDGMVMGTPAYMSPEQVTGSEIDARTDIFSLGVVLHEMATGKRPFAGHSSAELISAILRDAPVMVTAARPELPPELARTIRRCLEKDPNHRVQTAREICNEFRDMLRQPVTTVLAPQVSREIAAADSSAMRAADGFWVAVLPFKSPAVETRELADGLTEEITTGLSRFSYLRVIARGSTQRYAGETKDLREVGRELGARYVMEGSLRRAGSRLRVAVQLVDAISGVQLWAETYERAYDPDAIFELQDDLVPRIVSTVADPYGVLPRSMAEVLRNKKPEEFTAHQAVLRVFGYFERLDAEEHAVVRDILEAAMQRAPDHADGWAMLSMLYRGEVAQGFNPRPGSLDRAVRSARRAIELAPSSHLGHVALASSLFFQREYQPFVAEAERAIALNPNDGSAAAQMGLLMAIAGDWERGEALAERGMQLNPNHPGWYRFAGCISAYRKGDYRAALERIASANMPRYFYAIAFKAAALGELGLQEQARKAVTDLLEAKPDFAQVGRAEFLKWYDPAMTDSLIESLRKAGIEIR
jgi:serine/threonine protein kinase